jgi:phosphomannomutase
MLGNVFKAYDVRGVYPSPLTDKMAWQIGYGASRFLREDAEKAGKTHPMMGYIVVGRDMRKSSPKLEEELCDGITDQGGNVVRVGLVDTPFIYFAINTLDCAGGIQVTASHNPPEYNGFKVSKRQAKPVGKETGLDEIRQLAAMARPDRHKAEPADKGRTEERDLWEAYAEHVRRFLDEGAIAKRPLKIVVDASNGMAGRTLPKIFGSRGSSVEGLEIIEMNFDIASGEFVHEPNPLLDSATAALRERVVQERADLGVCFDGDGDRCVLVDEKGRMVGCDLMTGWLARAFLRETPGAAVVYDLRSSKAVEEDVLAAGGKPVKGRVGHVFLKQALAEHGGVFGGELSGHFYFRDNFNADSGVIALAAALSELARGEGTLSERIAPVARYAQSGERNFEVEDKDGALEELLEHFADRGEIDELDGVTIDCFKSEGWWANVRKSNTEPLLRLNLEAKTRELCDRMVGELAPMLGEPAAH